MSLTLELSNRRKTQRAIAKNAWPCTYYPIEQMDDRQTQASITALRSIMEMADHAARLGYTEFRILFLNNYDLSTLIVRTLEEAKYGVRYRKDIIGRPPAYFIKDNLWCKEEKLSELDAGIILSLKIH